MINFFLSLFFTIFQAFGSTFLCFFQAVYADVASKNAFKATSEITEQQFNYSEIMKDEKINT
jgi:hypothetical protein